MPQTLRGYLLLGILSIVIGYSLFAARQYLLGVRLSVTSPIDGTSIGGRYIEITGTTARASHLAINGAKAFSEQDGSFSYPLLLPEGYSIIHITATDRFSRSTTVRREVYVTAMSTIN